ncbi:MAG: chaperonin GroEL [Micavibrio sp.]
MTSKTILQGDEARLALAEGMRCLVQIVGVTAGPYGRTVLIEMPDGRARVTKDGYTIALSLELENKFGNAGTTLLKYLAYHADERAGDGSTAGIVMAGRVVEEVIKAVASGIDRGKVRKGAYRAFDHARSVLSEISRTLMFPEDLYKVAFIAANGDENIAFTLSDLYSDGSFQKKVLLNDGTGMETVVERHSGIKLPVGYASPAFVNDLRNNICTLDQPRVLITDSKIAHFQTLVPLLEGAIQEGEALLLIADDFSADVLSGLAVNIRQTGLKAAAMKLPANERQAFLDDLTEVSGTTVISEGAGDKLDRARISLAAGSLKSVRLEKDESILIPSYTRQVPIKRHLAKLKEMLSQSEDKKEIEKLEYRIAVLQDTLVEIHIGGLNDTEITEKKDRYQDALNSLQTALKEGVVPGGGVAFLAAARELLAARDGITDAAERCGYDIVIRALKAPAEQLLYNAGVNARYYVESILDEQDAWYGYDIRKQKFGNMDKMGVIDSARTSKEAINLAQSILTIVIQTDTVITDAAA